MKPLAALLVTALAVRPGAAAAPYEAAPEKVQLLPVAAGADIARQVASELKAEDFATLESRFDERLKEALPDAALRVFWAQTLQQAGALRGCGEPEMSVAGEYTLAFAPCTFDRQKAELRLTLRPDGRLAGMFLAPQSGTRPDWSAPGYVRAPAFTERETSVATGRVTLPATLSMPKGDGPFPGVVLVHGSGPHDRDETVGGTRVFQDLAQGLASRGIAVLRYEKRTSAYRNELALTRDMTLKDEVVDDAVAAVAVLRAAPRIDPARVFVLGHGLGGLLAPRIAAQDRRAAGVILLAAPWRPAAPGARDLELRALTPSLTLKALGLPVLVLQGERDSQTSMKEYTGWRRALRDVARSSFRSYPKLNHLFVAGEGPSTPAEYEKPGHVDRRVVEDVATFVHRGALPRAETKRKK